MEESQIKNERLEDIPLQMTSKVINSMNKSPYFIVEDKGDKKD
jgi:hypothetical protein